jgi:hypothetical protein
VVLPVFPYICPWGCCYGGGIFYLYVPEKPSGLSNEEELVGEFALNQTRQFIGGSLEPIMVMRMRS